ncbi:dipeptidase [Cellulosilyticum ruminicola]|uniref:dipeptidase n=1 Tax=Cellulosilyticum ruminicola TaxID=425254 RepID=UPI0006D00A7A|nr:dipeptidase [Cellulosilyticum ruminicola]
MPFIDMHCDTIDRLYNDKTHLFSNDYHIDIYKLRASKYFAQWFALYSDIQKVQESLMDYVKHMRDYFLQEIESNKDQIGLATNYEEYMDLRNKGKLAAFLSLEEAAPIGNDINELDTLWQMGVRMMTFTWNHKNQLGAPHSMKEGLSPFGKQVADRLNDYKILVDISHLSEQGVRDLATIYKKTIMASHCNAYALMPHSRNLSDDTIRLIASAGGVIGVNFYSVFLNGSDESLVEDIVRHIDHFYKVGGKEVLALGTDFDGMDCKLEVCDAGKMDKLVARLSKKYSGDVIDAITYGNAERLIKENL